MDEQRPWHRLFSMSWTDFFRGMPVSVDAERDLSLKKQLLDVTLIHKEPGPLLCQLPDGFENLTTYNLVSFRSHQQKLSIFIMEELLGHYVNLRKQVSPSMDEADLLPPDEFKLFAVAVRFPQNLVDESVVLEPIKQGVYEIAVLSKRIRLVVVSQLPEEKQNAMLHLFSANAQKVVYGCNNYRIKSNETSTLLLQLLQRFQLGAIGLDAGRRS